jgi:hypothetical protein
MLKVDVRMGLRTGVRLSALHFMMLRGELDRSPGRYRLGPVWVAGTPDNPPVYMGPDAAQVPELTDEFCVWLQEGDRNCWSTVRVVWSRRSDTTGAVRSVETSAGGLKWRRPRAPLPVIGTPSAGTSQRA